MKRGTYVSRSTYQKVCEENKRLLADIKILTAEGVNPDAILLKMKWQKKFLGDKQFHEALTRVAKEYLEEHPEIKKQIEGFSIRPKLDSNPKAFK